MDLFHLREAVLLPRLHGPERQDQLPAYLRRDGLRLEHARQLRRGKIRVLQGRQRSPDGRLWIIHLVSTLSIRFPFYRSLRFL